jgi:molybdenum cofactor synthesis domain-containing protein
VASAAILTIGNEIVSGDVENTNGSWLAHRLEAIGVVVRLIAAVPDDVQAIAAFVRAQARDVDVFIVTGGLGGTPDDVTRESIAAAFGVPQVDFPEVAASLRARFQRDPDYVTPWAQLPRGSRPLENPLGGAPGFVVGNVYVFPGLPAEMEAMYMSIEPQLEGGAPIDSWRRTYRTTESRIVGILREMEARHPGVVVGSYPSFGSDGSRVEVVVKSADAAALAAAAAWIEPALAAATA